MIAGIIGAVVIAVLATLLIVVLVKIFKHHHQLDKDSRYGLKITHKKFKQQCVC